MIRSKCRGPVLFFSSEQPSYALKSVVACHPRLAVPKFGDLLSDFQRLRTTWLNSKETRSILSNDTEILFRRISNSFNFFSSQIHLHYQNYSFSPNFQFDFFGKRLYIFTYVKMSFHLIIYNYIKLNIKQIIFIKLIRLVIIGYKFFG